MTRIYDTFLAGGQVMWPLLGLSVLTLAYVLERSYFWLKLIIQEKQVVHEVLTAAKVDLKKAQEIAQRAQSLTIGRFLVEPLKLKNPSPETFHLAIRAACDQEFVEMRKGDKLLESVILIAPLLGILGTASGLITASTIARTGNLNITDFSAVKNGIAQALISSVTAITVAIVAFVFFRIFVSLRSWQMDFFSKVGNQLELIYLQFCHEPSSPESIQEISQPNAEASH